MVFIEVENKFIMKLNPNILVTVLFFLTFLIHFSLWKFVFHLDEIIIVKFYLFLSVMFMLMITMIVLINRVVPEFLGLSVIGLILLKFGLMYLIRKKLNFEVIPGYKFHFIIPYFVLTTLLTYYAIKLINHDKKQ
ncbi:hypothetical protein SAMN05444360_12454 [Chryseobacterium carnipullorum]|uniref:Uncharacterized protein n=1 Tax=Chryseobacterium carnipullorum TaxID=1124835 RepID=A0A1M7N5B2_CHRCU|nr:hypothetical protein SAMN05444360_12454 [Chryseobacterium carnipullorum]STC96562.1 Uncharacterised protein [Chryseobacterium carnipullorum]